MPLTVELWYTNLELASTINNGGIQAKVKSKGGRKTNNTKSKEKGTTGKNDTSYSWKKVQPADGKAKTKTVCELTYHWCKYHAAWVLHEPEGNRPNGCLLQNKMIPTPAKSPGPASVLVNALSAILQDAQDENEE